MQRFPESFLGLDTSPCARQAFPLELVDGKFGLGSDILECQQAEFLLHGHTISFDASAKPYELASPVSRCCARLGPHFYAVCVTH